MLTLAYPWVLALLPLPLLMWWLVPPHHEARPGLVVPFLARLAEESGRRPAQGAVIPRAGGWRWLTLGFCWICAVVAVARPQIIEPPVTKDVPMRDLLLAVDLSGSMATKDFQNAQGETVDRLAAVKEVLDDFLTKRKGDRAGLIFFGSAPFVQAPFTEDLGVCRELLNEAQVNMAGPQTALGDAIGLAINLFDRSTVKERVLIVLTDGNDTSSQVPPAKAAQIAKDKGIVIDTVSVGDPQAAGEDALDVNTLKDVAEATGGLYSHAADRKQLDEIYARLDKIETHDARTISHRPRRDVFWWPLAAGLAASLLQLAFGLAVASRTAGESLPAAGIATASFSGIVLPFHFIRPEWLLALIPAGLVWWLLHRRADAARTWRGIVAPHLLAHLLSTERNASRFGAIDFAGMAWLFTIIAIAGPTWRHEPSPFSEDTGALAIVVKVAPSMKTGDVQPSRLERAGQKIHDLLQARGSARTSLVAYAGSAHIVMPATTDAGIIDTFVQAFDPKIMPSDGDAAADALAQADRSLARAGGGSILWITDSIAPEQEAALAGWRKTSSTPVRLWPPLLPGEELDSVRANAKPAKAGLVLLTTDDSDVRTLADAAKFAHVRSMSSNARWAESGYWLTPVIAGLVLSFFRRGWIAGGNLA